MLKRISIALFLSFLIILAWNHSAQAGFGISPPYVKSSKLIPGTHYEQKITLLRSSADEDLQANITINAPDIESWISIQEGLTFELPKDKLHVPMIVNVDVPEDAALGNYQGHINIRITPKGKGGGGVAVALGARVDIDLTLTKETFPDFKIRMVNIPDFETLGKPWSWRMFAWLFYRIRVTMKIENTGNVSTAPSKVTMEVYDLTEKNKLESLTDTSFKQIEPFETNNIIASFPTKLSAGQYWAKIKIYKEKEIVHFNKIAFTIAAKGTLPDGPPALGIWPWVMLSGMILLLVIALLLLVKVKIWRYIYKILYVILWPLLFIYRRLAVLAGRIKAKFWAWMHNKAKRHQHQNKKNNNEKN